MTVNRTYLVVFPLAAMLGLACNNASSSGASPTETTSAAVTAAPVVSAAASASASSSASARPRTMMHHAGMAGWFLAAAQDLPTLKDEQKASLEKIDAPLKALEAGPHTEGKDFRTELSAETKAGKIDTTKLEPLYVAIEKAGAARQAAEADALNGLHAALDATQRKALTDSMRTKQKDIEEKMKAHEADRKPEEMQKRKLDRMTKDLDLDDGQQKKVDAILSKDKLTQTQIDAKKDEMKKKMETLLTAFEADTFDAKKADLGPAGKKVREPMEKEVTMLTALLPILKPEQKDKLVAKMDRPPMRPGMMGRPGGEQMGSMFDDPEGPMPH